MRLRTRAPTRRALDTRRHPRARFTRRSPVGFVREKSDPGGQNTHFRSRDGDGHFDRTREHAVSAASRADFLAVTDQLSPALAAEQAEAESAAPAQPLDREAQTRLDHLYREHWAELVAYVRRSFGAGPPDPEDAVQAAFARYATLPNPEFVNSPRPFLYRLATNFVLDFKRKAQVRARFAAGAEMEQMFGGAEEITPERVLEAKERAGRLEGVLARLKPAYREAIVLNRVHGLSIAEIARRLSLSESEVRRRLQKALLVCTTAMAAFDGEAAPAPRKGGGA